MVLRVLLFALLAASCAAAQPLPDTLRAPADSILVFGWSVDADADRLLVGAWEAEAHSPNAQGSTPPANPTGTAFVYRRDGNEWVVEGRLLSDRIGNQDCFSWSMDIKGDLAAIGARCEVEVLPDGTVRGGAVYLFRRVGTEWIREAKLSNADVPEPWGSRFGVGYVVALGDDMLVTGAPFTENPANPDADGASGAVHIFERRDGVWEYTATLVNGDTDEALNESFGYSLAVEGMQVVVGAPQDGPDEIERGAAYVFRRAGDGSWIEQDKLLAYDPTDGAEFGLTVAASGGEVVVGSNWAAYPLERWAGSWRVQASLVAAPGFVPVGVARYGDRIVTVDPLFEQERAVLFAKEAGQWEGTDLPLAPIEGWLPEMASITATHAFIGHPQVFIGPDTNPESYVLIYDLGTATSSESSSLDKAVLTLTVAPNPVRRDATVRFETPRAGDVQLTVYDVLGREVVRLAEGTRAAGGHVIELDVAGLAPGVYVVRAQTDGGAATQRLTVLR